MIFVLSHSGGSEDAEQRIYYYNNGISNAAVGTWTGLNIRSDDGWSSGSLSTTNKALTITVNNSSYGVGATKKLDLSFISELRIVATAPGFGGGDYDQAVVWISPVRSTSTDTNYVIKQELETGTNIIDVSSLSGSYYLVIDAASDYSRTLTVTEIYGVVNSNTKFLYYFGNTYEGVTGGWGLRYSEGTGGTVTVESERIIISANQGNTGSGSVVYAGPANLIDLTSFSTLRAKMTKVSGGTIQGSLLVAESVGSGPLAYSNEVALTANIESEITLDVRAISGEKAVYVSAANSGANGAAAEAALLECELVV